MHCTARAQGARIQFPQERIEDAEEPRQRFAAAGRRREQDRFAIQDRRHREQLRVRERR